MVKPIGFLCFFILLAVASHAQLSIGIEGGVSSSYLNTNISNRASSEIDYAAGYTITAPLQFKLKSWLYLEAIPGVTQKNYYLNRTDSAAGIYTLFKNTYVQLPIALKFVYGRRLQVFGDAGFYTAYWLTGRQKGITPNIFNVIENVGTNGNVSTNIEFDEYNEKYTFNPAKDSRLEFGWIFGIGGQYHINEQYMLTAGARVYEALSDQQKKYINEIPQYNQTFTFALGIMKTFR